MPATADFSPEQIDRNKLLTALIDSFGENDLRSLCFELNTDYDHLPPGGVADKARELVLRCERERRLPELTEAVLQARPHIPRYSLIRDTRTDQSPFKGLPAFEETDANLFFGRDALIAELIAHLHDHHFLAVIGASGSGKSSVVRAGVVPALKGHRPLPDGATLPEGSHDWHTLVITPTAVPLEELAHVLTRDLVTTTEQKTIQAELAADSDSLHLHLRKFLERQGRSHLLLVVDQFEELFTLVRSEPERRAFIENLLTAVSHPHPTLHLILTLRADFYHHCGQFDALRQVLASQQYYIGEMSREELRQAIELPAQRSGLAFEPGLVELLLRDVGAAEGLSPEPGALPLLSHALLETWRRRETNTLTLAGYTEAGGVHGAIAKTAESTYQHLTPTQQAIARNIFLRLTELGEGTQDTRRRADLDELLPRTDQVAEVETVLKMLADARLVTTHEEAAEVAHEALIREWPTLRRWLDDDRQGLRIHRQLTEDATEWERTARDVNYLYRGGRLAQAREWAAMSDADLNELEQAFLDAGLAQQQDELAEAKARAEREAAAARREAKVAHELAATMQLLIAEIEILQIELKEKFNIGKKWEQRFETLISICEQHAEHFDKESLQADVKVGYVQFQPYSISRLIHECVDIYTSTAQMRNIEIQMDLDQQINEHGEHQVLNVCMDRVALRQAIQNVIDNAVKYSFSGTKGHPRWVSVMGQLCTVSDQPGYEISIQNLGVGIEPDELADVFEPGFQSKRRFDEGRRGYGMGLTFVKTCVENHEGTISILSEPQQRTGWLTTLTIWLPFENKRCQGKV